MANPWEEGLPEGLSGQEELEQLQGQVSEAGLGAMAGILLAATLGPMAARRGARALIKRGANQGALSAARRTAAEGVGGLTAGAAERAAIRNLPSRQRWGAAAAEAVEHADGGRIDITRFLDRGGLSRPMELRQEASRWHRFRQSDEVRSGGVLRGLSSRELIDKHGGQARLFKSAFADWKREQILALPITYAVDSYAGITQGPGEAPAWYNVPGHVANFVSWLPTYATYETLGRGAMLLPGLAKGIPGRLVGTLEGQEGVARGISTAFTAAERMQKGAQRAGRAINDAYTQRIRGKTDPFRRALQEAGQFAKRIGERATRPSPAMARPRGYDLHESATIRGAADVFTDDAKHNPIFTILKTLDRSDTDLKGLEQLYDTLFVDAGQKRTSTSFLGRLFKGRDMTLGEARSMASDEAKKQLEQLTKRIDNFQKRVAQEAPSIKNKRALELVKKMDANRLRVSGMVQTSRGVHRMPTGGELRAMSARVLDRATGIYMPGSRHGFSLFNILQLHTLTEPRSAVTVLRGEMDVGGTLHKFGKGSGSNVHLTGFAITDTPGSMKGKVYGLSADSRKLSQITANSQLFVSGYGADKLMRIRRQRHKDIEGVDVRSELHRLSERGRESRWRAFLHDKFHIGGGRTSHGFERIKDGFNRFNPRRLFREDSELWELQRSELRPREGRPVAAAIDAMAQARTGEDAMSVYLTEELFSDAASGILNKNTLEALGGARGILSSADATVAAAREVVRSATRGGDDTFVASPSLAQAKRILRRVDAHPNNLHNTHGTPQVDILRRFIFEQGVLGIGDGTEVSSRLISKINRMVKSRVLRGDVADEAQAGLVHLQMVARTKGQIRNPYTALREATQSGTRFNEADPFTEVLSTLHENREVLQRFGSTRRRVDFRYHQKAIRGSHGSISGQGQVPFYTASNMLEWLGDVGRSGLDTTRDALSAFGLGWDANAPGNQIYQAWRNRAVTAIGLSVGYGMLDTALDVFLPDDMPFSEGITMAVADVAARSRLAASRIYDAVGVTSAAQYLEGLMPKSTSTLPGMLAGAWMGSGGGAAGVISGALVGGVAGRMATETLKDTPFEALSLLPIAAPFVSDLSEDYESTLAKYEGREWVPVRKGRYYLLSTGDYAGSRIEQWRPNWFSTLKADVKAGPALYGSEVEKFIFKELPLIDFSIGDIFDPHYLEKKHYFDRPYVEPDVPFSDVPIIGPSLGRALGKAYLTLHPLGSTDPMHVEQLEATFGPDSAPGGIGPSEVTSVYSQAILGSVGQGYTAMGSSAQNLYREGYMGAAFMGQGTIVGANSMRATIDEQMYRMSEALGFIGFVSQEIMGGEGVFRDPIFEDASAMTSAGRTWHDLNLGDFLGVGEGLRRLYPVDRRVERAGPRNTMPTWLGDEFLYGDPYCLLPETFIEVDDLLIEAQEAHRRVQDGETLYARTHEGRHQVITESAVREVDEEVVRIHTDMLPWPLEVTKGHPILVYRGRGEKPEWVLAGDIVAGDRVMSPAGPIHKHVYTSVDYPRGGVSQKNHWANRWTLPFDAVTMEGILAVFSVQPAPNEKYRMHGVTSEERFRIERAFGMPGCKYVQREQITLNNLRREMADYGLPRSMVGMPMGVLKPLVHEWGYEEDYTIFIEITPERLERTPREDWSLRLPYEPKTTDEELVRAAAYTLWRAFLVAETPAVISKIDNGYVVKLIGRSASSYLFPHWFRSNQRRGDAEYSGRATYQYEPDAPRRASGVVVNTDSLLITVSEVETVHYKGPVYAFQVDGDESFVAAGISTHNSKIMMGEMLLPGAGLEQTGTVYGERELQVEDLDVDTYQTSLRMLGLKEEPQEMGWAREQVTRRMIEMGTAVREQAVYVDASNQLIGVAAAANKGNNPIHVEALYDDEFRQLAAPRELDRERVNALLGASKRTKGLLVYVNVDTGEVQSFVEQFDTKRYNASLQKLQEARTLAKEYEAMGYGAPGAMYSTTERLRVLMNANPFGDEWRVEMRKAKALYASGAMSMRERQQFAEVTSMHEKMGLPFEIYQERFASDQLLSPDPYYYNLTYNENIQAAAEYSLPERIVGSVWEKWGNLRTPLHSRFFGTYNLEELYRNRQLLGRDYQDWGSPIDDFVKPYMRGLMAAEDPLQGGLSFAVSGFTFGGPAMGFIGGAVGATYGTLHGAYRSITDTEYIPREVEERREAQSNFDRLQYYRAKRLYDATGSTRYLDEMQRSAYGWTQDGLSGTGWAKDRRMMYGPAQRLESPLFQGDRGFGSPWRGIQTLAGGFKDQVNRHSGKTLTITDGLKRAYGSAPAVQLQTRRATVLPDPAQIRDHITRRQVTFTEAAPASRASPISRELMIEQSGHAAGKVRSEGLAPQGFAKTLRQSNTQTRSNLGFGSPWRGEDPFAAVMWQGLDPMNDPIPPEMFSAFPAAQYGERDFMRAGLLLQDPRRQQRFMDMVSPDMAAMLDVGWNYLYGQDMYGVAENMDARGYLDIPLASHPVMGMGAFSEGYRIRTYEDLGVNMRDVGEGWKSSMMKLNDAIVSPDSVASIMNGDVPQIGRSPEDVRAIIKGALAQLGVLAEVDVVSSSGPTEVHFTQSL